MKVRLACLRRCVSAVLFVPALFPSALMAAQSPPAVAARPAIQAVYDQFSVAFAQHDLARFMSYFASDYVVVDEKGTKRNKEQARRQYEAQLRQIKTVASHYVIQSLTPTPQGTLAEIKMHTNGTGEKRVLFAKFHGAFSDDLWVRDLWVSTPEGWRLQSRQTLQDHMQMHVR